MDKAPDSQTELCGFNPQQCMCSTFFSSLPWSLFVGFLSLQTMVDTWQSNFFKPVLNSQVTRSILGCGLGQPW